MVRDRLKELQEAQGNGIELEPVAVDIAEIPFKDSMDEFFSEIEDIRRIIDEIQTNVSDVKVKHGTLLLTPHQDEIIKMQLDDLTAEIKRKSQNVKGRLTRIDRELGDGTGSVDANLRIRKTQNSQLTRNFVEVMNDYNKAQLDYKDRCKKNIQRQFMITGQKVEDEELEEMLEQGELSVFSQGIIAQTQQAKQSLQEIEARHADLIKLETSIKELSQMFMDMALLISSQGEMVDNIQHIVETTGIYVEQAREQVKQAGDYQKKARKKRIMISICLAISALILLILLYRFLLG